MSEDIREAHPASWYIHQGIKDIESVPETYRAMVSEHIETTERKLIELDRRIRTADTRYNEVLGLMHELGDRIATATEALVAYSRRAQNDRFPEDPDDPDR